MRIYVDASAAAKLLTFEDETPALKSFLVTAEEHIFVSAVLLETELRRTALRKGVPQADVSALLAGIDLIDLPRAVFQQAGLLPVEGLRSLVALHLASAMRVESAALLAYDHRLLAAADAVGLSTFTPV